MSATCDFWNPYECGKELGEKTHEALNPFETICVAFAEAATDLLKQFAKAFAKFPNIDLTGEGVTDVYSLSMGIGIFVAAILLLLQTARTAITHEGKALAEGLVGIGKAALAFMLTLSLATAGLLAADELTKWIIKESFGSAAKLAKRLSGLMAQEAITNLPQLLLIALLVMILVFVLWCELLLRNAAIAILIATSPIAAAGMVSGTTKQWWSKLVRATIQLIILKPTIALIFALGFSLAGKGNTMTDMLAGLLILLLAVIAWPAIAKFLTFTSTHSGGGAGLGAVLGFAASQVTTKKAGIAGASRAEFGSATSDRTMQVAAARMAQGGGKAKAAAAGGLGPIVAALQAAQKGANSLAQRMETMAAHGGLDGANPYTTPAGAPSGHPTIPDVASDVASGLRNAPAISPAPSTNPTSQASSANPPPQRGVKPPSPDLVAASRPATAAPVSAVKDLREPKRFHGPPPPK